MASDDELISIFRAEVEEELEQLHSILDGESKEWDVHRLFRIAHNVKGAAGVVRVEAVRRAAHALEELFSSLRASGAISEEQVSLTREGAALLSSAFEIRESDASFLERVDEYLDRARSAVGGEPDESSADIQTRSERSSDAASESPTDDPRAPGHSETVRVSHEKLDRLMEFSGELLTVLFHAHRMMGQSARLLASLENWSRSSGDLALTERFRSIIRDSRELREGANRHANGLTRLNEGMQDAIRGLRMVPLDNLRLILGRVSREACAVSEKRARIEFTGLDTEVDRQVLARIKDPLIHLVRNAIAHGIEPPEERRSRNKPETGLVTLTAQTTGARIRISVSDDGAGIDVDHVLERGVELGMIGEDENLSEKDAFDLLLRSGFSTRGASNELAGRGVGLDVVHENVQALGGELEIRSIRGSGTTIIIELPLVRLTTRAMELGVGERSFFIPMDSIERTILVAESEIRVVDGQPVVANRNEPVPVCDLAELLDLERADTEHRPAVIIADHQLTRALLIDEVRGEKEIVIQPLPWNLVGLPNIAGCTVPDGERVVPVLDAGMLLEQAPVRAAAERRRDLRTGIRILVADDSITSRTLERNILVAAGFEVSVAVDGRQAWEILQQEPFDLLISDVDMPYMTGIDLTRRVRASDQLADLPVVLVTSLSEEKDLERGADAGANAYIVKGTFDHDQLLEAVRRLV